MLTSDPYLKSSLTPQLTDFEKLANPLKEQVIKIASDVMNENGITFTPKDVDLLMSQVWEQSKQAKQLYKTGLDGRRISLTEQELESFGKQFKGESPEIFKELQKAAMIKALASKVIQQVPASSSTVSSSKPQPTPPPVMPQSPFSSSSSSIPFILEEEYPEYIDFTLQREKTKTTSRVWLRTDGDKIADPDGNTWLHIAAQSGHQVMIKGFVKGDSRVNLEARNNKNYTPLMEALENRQQLAIEALLAKGADAQAATKDGTSVLHMAAVAPFSILGMICNKLQAQGKLNLEVRNKDDYTPLFVAIRGKNPENAAFLLRLEANPNASTKENQSVLHAAAGAGDTATLKLLLEKNAKIIKGKLYTYETPIQNGIKSHIKFATGATPLFIASTKGDEEMARALIAAGDNPNGVLSDGTTCLFYAIKNPGVCKALLENEANPKHKSKRGETPMIQLDHGTPSLELLKLLLQYGADPNALDACGRSILWSCCWGFGDDDMDKIVALLNKGADPNHVYMKLTAFEHFIDKAVTGGRCKGREYEITALFLKKEATVTSFVSSRLSTLTIMKTNPQFKELIDSYNKCVIM